MTSEEECVQKGERGGEREGERQREGVREREREGERRRALAVRSPCITYAGAPHAGLHVSQPAQGEEREREKITHTHTHTHTERERERERERARERDSHKSNWGNWCCRQEMHRSVIC